MGYVANPSTAPANAPELRENAGFTLPCAELCFVVDMVHGCVSVLRYAALPHQDPTDCFTEPAVIGHAHHPRAEPDRTRIQRACAGERLAKYNTHLHPTLPVPAALAMALTESAQHCITRRCHVVDASVKAAGAVKRAWVSVKALRPHAAIW